MSPDRLTRWSAIAILISPFVARAAKVEWVPVRASGPYEIRGNEIILEQSGQRVWFELRVSDWAPEELYYGSVKVRLATSLASGAEAFPRTLLPYMPGCGSSADCAAAVGPMSECRTYCDDGEFDSEPCYYAGNCAGGTCALRCSPIFIDVDREDSLLRGREPRYRVFTNGRFSYDVWFHGGTLGALTDDGGPKYLATMVLDVPAGSSGNLAVIGTARLIGPSEVKNASGLLSVLCHNDGQCDDSNGCTSERCDLDSARCRVDLNYDPNAACCNPSSGAHVSLERIPGRCTYQTCDPLTGRVTVVVRPNQTTCGHRNSGCDPLGRCLAGTCYPPRRWYFGQRCGDPSSSECDNPDICDGDGHCIDNLDPDGTLCDDGVFCNGVDECRSGECAAIGSPRCGARSCDEALETCPFEPTPFRTIPPHNGGLSTGFYPRIFVFEGDRAIPLDPPATGDFDFRELLSDGRVGPDLSHLCRFALQSVGDAIGAALVVNVDAPLYGEWYALRHVGAWAGLAPFAIYLSVQEGDANGDGQVNAADLAAINTMIGRWDSGDPFQFRFDVNRDARVDFEDVLYANSFVPTRRSPKPSGHGP